MALYLMFVVHHTIESNWDQLEDLECGRIWRWNANRWLFFSHERGPNLQEGGTEIAGVCHYGRQNFFFQKVHQISNLNTVFTSFGKSISFNMSLRLTLCYIKSCPLETFDMDDNPLLYDPNTGPFTSLQDAFDSLVASSIILIDH